MLRLRTLSVIAIFFMSGCIVVPTYKARISLIRISESNSDVHVNNLLLIGTGPVSSRIFLDNLSDEMLQLFKSRGVQADFSYIGKIPQSTALNFDSLDQDKYDSYLVFKAANKSYLDMTKVKYAVIGPGVGGNGYGNQYSDKFEVTLYNGKVKQQIIWRGELVVDFDIANHSRYKQISSLIFNELVKSRVHLN